MGGALKHAPLPVSQTEQTFVEKTQQAQTVAKFGLAEDRNALTASREAQARTYWEKFGGPSTELIKLGGQTRQSFNELDQLAVTAISQKPYALEDVTAVVGGVVVGSLAGTIGKPIAEAALAPARLLVTGVEKLAEITDSPAIDMVAGVDRAALNTADRTFNPTWSEVGEMFTGPSEMVERVNKVFAKAEAAHKEYRAAAKELMGARDELMEGILTQDEGKAEAAAQRLLNAVERFKTATKELETALYPIVSKDSALMESYRGFVNKSEEFLAEIVVTTATTVTGLSAAKYGAQYAAKGIGKAVEKIAEVRAAARGAEAATEVGANAAATAESLGQATASATVTVGRVARGASAAERAALAGREATQIAGTTFKVGRKAEKIGVGVYDELESQEEFMTQNGIAAPPQKTAAPEQYQAQPQSSQQQSVTPQEEVYQSSPYYMNR